jgi:hypothetical protein
MILLDVFYVAVATIAVIALLQLITFAVVRIMYPPEPKVIYRDVPVQIQAQPAPVVAPPNLPFSIGAPPTAIPPPQIPPQFGKQEQPAFTKDTQDIQLPEYEPRIIPSSNSVRLDSGLPDGLQETRPPGI